MKPTKIKAEDFCRFNFIGVDNSRARVVNLLLLPLLTFLYYTNFISPISEKTILSVLLTIIHVFLFADIPSNISNMQSDNIP